MNSCWIYLCQLNGRLPTFFQWIKTWINEQSGKINKRILVFVVQGHIKLTKTAAGWDTIEKGLRLPHDVKSSFSLCSPSGVIQRLLIYMSSSSLCWWGVTQHTWTTILLSFLLHVPRNSGSRLLIQTAQWKVFLSWNRNRETAQETQVIHPPTNKELERGQKSTGVAFQGHHWASSRMCGFLFPRN